MIQKYHRKIANLWTPCDLEILTLEFSGRNPPSHPILRPEQGGRNEVAKKVTWNKVSCVAFVTGVVQIDFFQQLYEVESDSCQSLFVLA